MAIVNAENLTAGQIIAIVQEALSAHRAALIRLGEEIYPWTSGIAAADLEAAPINMPAPTANALLAAVADAHGEYLIHTAGSDPNHPINPPYSYGNSQTALLGPLA
jgi:hypothetical protein